ncbi:MAG: zinc ribbon domain-containing protein [Erysipelotrichaceae bacterium]|nr:zinc ribbon domain-containing protein [Erysipelotrichaceae bacterium]
MKCPKCGATTPKNARFCPSCGIELAVDETETVESEVIDEALKDPFTKSKEKIKAVFIKIKGILIIVSLSLAMLLIWTSLLNGNLIISANNSSVSRDFGYFSYFLYSIWIDIKNGAYGTGAQAYLPASISLLFIITNIVITIVFGIKGILNARTALKNETDPSLKNSVIVLISNTILYSILSSSLVSYLSNQSFDASLIGIGFGLEILTSLISLTVFISLIFETFMKFEKDKILQTIERALAIIIASFALMNIQSGGQPILKVVDSSGKLIELCNPIYFAIKPLSDFIGNGDVYVITTSVLSLFDVVLSIAVIMWSTIMFWVAIRFVHDEIDTKTLLNTTITAFVIGLVYLVLVSVTSGTYRLYPANLQNNYIVKVESGASTSFAQGFLSLASGIAISVIERARITKIRSVGN